MVAHRSGNADAETTKGLEVSIKKWMSENARREILVTIGRFNIPTATLGDAVK